MNVNPVELFSNPKPEIVAFIVRMELFHVLQFRREIHVVNVNP
jgi:hypothetical protein